MGSFAVQTKLYAYFGLIDLKWAVFTFNSGLNGLLLTIIQRIVLIHCKIGLIWFEIFDLMSFWIFHNWVRLCRLNFAYSFSVLKRTSRDVRKLFEGGKLEVEEYPNGKCFLLFCCVIKFGASAFYFSLCFLYWKMQENCFVDVDFYAGVVEVRSQRWALRAFESPNKSK